MTLTQTLLRQLANPESYSRGKQYFEDDAVRKIKRDGITFTGKVAGSGLYTVSLKLTASRPTFTCSCPYNYEGICKHSVAFGLAVLDEYGPTFQSAPVAGGVTWFSPADEKAAPSAPVWERISDEKKLNFLRQLLDKQPDLAHQLALFAGVIDPMPAGKQTAALSPDVVGSEVHELLTDLRFDEDTLDLGQDDWYSEEGQDPTPLIGEVLQPYADQFDLALRQGRLADAMSLYMGVYEGTQAATEPAHDEFNCAEDYPEITLRVWQDLLTEPLAALVLRVFNDDQLRRALQQLADRMRHFAEQEEEAEEEAENEEEDYQEPLYTYTLKAFEPLLLALVNNEPSARLMQEALVQHVWQHLGTDYLQLRIAEQSNDPTLWLHTADQFAETNPDIALQLLNRHRLAGNQPALLNLLQRLSGAFPKRFDAFVLEHISPETLVPGPDLTLYLAALHNRCLSHGQLPDYLLLRTYLTPDQRQAFIAEINRSYHTLFCVQVLHAEGRTDELLPIMEKLAWSSTRNMAEILTLVAETYPAECMALTRKKSLQWLETGKRDRSMYGQIAEWVSALHNVPGQRSPAATLAATLVSTYPRLYALRDELRQKGLAR